MAGTSGKDWRRRQQRRRLGDEYISCHMENTVVRRGNMASRSARVPERGMQWAAHARHVVYCTALDWTVLHCPAQYC